MKKFNIPNQYKSEIISKIKSVRQQNDRMKKDQSPTEISLGQVTFYLARHFGFCYGVENAIETAFRSISENPDKLIFLLSEIIHNPMVNQDLLNAGVKFIMNNEGEQLIPWDEINEDDIVIIPAFGTTLEIEELLLAKNINPKTYSSTCPFVEKVWNRASQIGHQGYSIVIHGKPNHEESRATFSHSSAVTPSVIVSDMNQAILLSKYIKAELPEEQFYIDFRDQYSENFNPQIHLQKFGVVNQTTMLASETQAIAEFLKATLSEIKPNTDVKEYFADTKDTLCYATNDNQTAINHMLNVNADAAFVIGGYNSSNTSHLYELMEHKLLSFYIKDHNNILENEEVVHWNFRNKIEEIKSLNINSEHKKFLISAGASCPDKIVEEVIYTLAKKFNVTENWEMFKTIF